MAVELATMTHWFVVLTIALAGLLHATRVLSVVFFVFVSLALVGYIQFFVWDDRADGLFTGHWMYMMLILRAGTEVLRGDGYPLQVHPLLGGGAAVTLAVIMYHETVVTHLHMFHNYVHMTIYSCGVALACSAISEQTAARCIGESAATSVRSVRKFFDPCCFVAMGLLLISHAHDPAPLSIALHSTFGYLLLVLAAACFLCALCHDVLPFSSPACEAMRSFHALGWILTGGITFTMCIVQYLTPSGGFAAYLVKRGIHASTTFEEASAYIAATVLGSSVHLALLHCSTRAMRATAHAAGGKLEASRVGPWTSRVEADEREQRIGLIATPEP